MNYLQKIVRFQLEVLKLNVIREENNKNSFMIKTENNKPLILLIVILIVILFVILNRNVL